MEQYLSIWIESTVLRATSQGFRPFCTRELSVAQHHTATLSDTEVSDEKIFPGYTQCITRFGIGKYTSAESIHRHRLNANAET